MIGSGTTHRRWIIFYGALGKIYIQKSGCHLLLLLLLLRLLLLLLLLQLLLLLLLHHCCWIEAQTRSRALAPEPAEIKQCAGLLLEICLLKNEPACQTLKSTQPIASARLSLTCFWFFNSVDESQLWNSSDLFMITNIYFSLKSS